MKTSSSSFAIGLLLWSNGINSVLAATAFDQDEKIIPFVQNVADLHLGLELPVTVQREPLPVQRNILVKRAARGGTDNRIEPLEIRVPASAGELGSFVKKYALVEKRSELFDYLAGKLRQHATSKETDDLLRKVAINESALKLFQTYAITNLLAKPHQSVSINGEDLQKNRALSVEFVAQLKRYLPESQLRKVARDISQGEDISLDESLLPVFAQRMVGRYTSFRGPNCFQAALAFQGESFTQSKFINVKKEAGYHPAMINYDELWRALKAHFYEIDAHKTKLEYGDMLVFMDVPESNATWSMINYRWIRHASTYLFGNFTFSKGSKSPDTPYSVKTVEDEWKAWQGMSKNIGLKVFRRRADGLMPAAIPPRDLEDWVF